MSTSTESPSPTITRSGTAPATRHKLFVNVPVTDLQRSIRFFEALGFAFNPQFTDATATCMLVGEDAYVMLLTRDKFGSFTSRTVGDPQAATSAMFALSVDSREAVDAMIAKAIEAGGTDANQPQDHGFMYGRAFYDVDGHHWEAFWMDQGAVEGGGQ